MHITDKTPQLKYHISNQEFAYAKHEKVNGVIISNNIKSE